MSVVLGASTQGDAKPATSYGLVIEKLERFIRDEQAAKDLPAITIALVEGNRTVWVAAFGPASASGKTAASAETVYRVGSVSKLYNALAVMRLVSEGTLDLDEDVKNYLPSFLPDNLLDKPITLRQLLSHRSGIVREPPVGSYFDASSPSIEKTVASLNQTRLVFEPGARTKYSNAAVTVAGLVVERASGTPYDEYLTHKVLTPLGMKSSSFRSTGVRNDRLPMAWMWAHHRGRFPAPVFDMGILPAGNLYSTVTDMSQLLIAMFHDEPPAELGIGREELRSMIEPSRGEHSPGHDYGIGFRLGHLDRHPTFEHGGAVYGYATLLKGLADAKVGVVVAIALDGANGVANRIGDYAIRLMLAQQSGEPLPDIETSQPLSEGEAAQMAGHYWNGGQSIKVYCKDNQAFMAQLESFREIRRMGGELVIDDVLRYGPTLSWDADRGTLLLAGQAWTRREKSSSPVNAQRWASLTGEYGWDHNVLYVYEEEGNLRVLIEWFYDYPLTEAEEGRFSFPASGLYHDEEVRFVRDPSGSVTHAVAGGVEFPRRTSSATGLSKPPLAAAWTHNFCEAPP